MKTYTAFRRATSAVKSRPERSADGLVDPAPLEAQIEAEVVGRPHRAPSRARRRPLPTRTFVDVGLLAVVAGDADDGQETRGRRRDRPDEAVVVEVLAVDRDGLEVVVELGAQAARALERDPRETPCAR